MKKTIIIPLVLVTAAAVLSGCATQKTRTGRNTNLLFGLVTIDKGDYQPASVVTPVDFNSNKYIGNAGKSSGTQVKLAWGAFTLNDY